MPLRTVLAALTLFSSAPDQITTLRAGDRARAAVIVLGPRGAPAHQASMILDATARVLDRRTDLRPLSPEQAGYDLEAFAACSDRERLACWVREARRGGDALEGGASYLFLLSVRPADASTEEISLIMLDTRAALESEAQARERSADLEAIENAIFETAVRARELTVAGGSATAFEEALARELEPMLAPIGRWDPYAKIELTGAEVGMIVSIDGRAIGETTSANVRIEELRPGRRKLALAQRDQSPIFEINLELVREKIAPVRAILPVREIRASTINRTVMVAGFSVIAAGAALVVAGVAGAPDYDALAVCPGGECSARSRYFSSFCEVASGEGANDCGSGGLLVAPLGIALAAAGTSWSVGAIAEEEREVPLISLIAGAVAGVAAYGALALIGR